MKAEDELAQLLDELSAFIRRYLVLRPAQADVCALWCIHTHALEASEFTPYLHIFAASLRAGKTLLLKLLALLVAKPWYTGRVSGAVLVRKTDKDHPTLLLDESDAAFHIGGEYAERLRGILNTGFERDGTISLCVGKDWAPKDFSTFSPKAIAGIGRLPDTIEDRTIPIQLKRKLPKEVCEDFRKKRVKPIADRLRERMTRWAAQNVAALVDAEPMMPDGLNDRQQDVCEPLLAIADRASGEWPSRARLALVALCTSRTVPDDSVPLRLLSDIRAVFHEQGSDRIGTRELLQRIYVIDEAPWAEFDRGGSLTPHGLAKLLRPFGIVPRDIRFNGSILKGYSRADFEDSWERYLPPAPFMGSEAQQGQQAAIYAPLSEIGKGQPSVSVADVKSEESTANTRVVADVALSG